jgi:hypothetical protein
VSPPSSKKARLPPDELSGVPSRPDYLRTTMIQAFAVTVIDDAQGDRKVRADADPRAPEPALPSIGDVIGSHYRLVRLLGEGAFGKVYLAQRIDVPEHQVALKLLPRSVYEGRNVERELVMLATVGHPNVVQLKDHGMGPSFVWLTMPVYEGETLAERLDRGPLTLREAYDIFLPIARGLEALHAAGLRHQDIKPENIFLAVFGGRLHPVLLDLGVAAEREATFVAGTLIYGAPEQVAAFKGNPGELPLTEKMDTYGLGTTILVALAGPDRFPGLLATSTEEIVAAHEKRAASPLAEDAIPSLKGRPRELLEGALKRWLALDPRERPAMSELAGDLDVLLEPEREEARAEERRRLQHKTTMLRVRISAAGLLLAILGGALYAYSKRETLELAGQLEAARRHGEEQFDKLDMCVASHALEKNAGAACKEAREKDQAQCRATLDAMLKAGSSEHAKEIQDLERNYAGRLKGCEDSATAAAKACSDARAALTNAWNEERAKLTTDAAEKQKLADERQKLADERAAAIEALKAERDKLAASLAACGAERDQCKSASSQTSSAQPSASSSPAASVMSGASASPAAQTQTMTATLKPEGSAVTPSAPPPPPPAVPPPPGPPPPASAQVAPPKP